MKKNFYLSLLTILVSMHLQAQYANQALSNLTSPTAINQSLLPNADSIYNLGSFSQQWKNVYLKNVFVNKTLFLHTSPNNSGTFVGSDAGRVTSGADNTSVGFQSMYLNTTGHDNVALGYKTLYRNSSGFYNTSVGAFALRLNTVGKNNVAFGCNSLENNVKGNDNVALGYRTLYSNTEGLSNIAIGSNALKANTSGQNNVAVGMGTLTASNLGGYNVAIGTDAMGGSNSAFYNIGIGYRANFKAVGNSNIAIGQAALETNDAGSNNVAIGLNAMVKNGSGSNNVAIGDRSLSSNTSGSFNSAFGGETLRFNTTGNYNTALGFVALVTNTTGFNNTATGYQALASNTSGYTNTANGYQALFNGTEGAENTAIGNKAANANTNGSQNTAVGNQALYSNSSGLNNSAFGNFSGVVYVNNSPVTNGTTLGCTFIGSNTHTQSTTNEIYNSTALGFNAEITTNDQVVVGNTAVTSIGGYANWTNFSDGRYKKNIKEDVPGLSFITKLHPVTYNLDVESLNNKMVTASINKAAKNNEAAASAANEKSRIVYTGFVAQDVEKVAEELHYDFSGVKKPANDKDFYGLRYAEFVVPLVKAVQELDTKTKEIDQLKTQVQQQAKEINDLKLLMQQFIQTKSISTNGSFLGQNAPNPTKGNTIIPFQIAQGSRTAAIQIIETGSGKIVKTIPVNVNATQTVLNANSLAAGSYMYTLIVDGKQADSKQMILAK